MKKPTQPQLIRQKQKQKKFKRYVDQLTLPEDKSNIQAIAIKYDSKRKSKAPRIVALGKGAFAEQILQIAEDNKIPFYEDQSLTELLSKLHIDREIPPQLYTLVAEVLAFVYQLDTLAKQKKQVFRRK